MKAKNYIRMCEQAEEIQKLFNPDSHNHVCSSGGTIWTQIDRDSYKYDKYTEYGHQYICIRDGYLMHCVWLPTQEQLQEMMRDLANKRFFDNFPKHYIPQEGEYVFPVYLLWWFSQWVVFQKRSETKEHSFNELWLAFVMYEKYHKIWDGKTWIKST